MNRRPLLCLDDALATVEMTKPTVIPGFGCYIYPIVRKLAVDRIPVAVASGSSGVERRLLRLA